MAQLFSYLYCYFCKKCVSTGFTPVPTDTPDKGLILRGIVICPECIEKEIIKIDPGW